jgi:hypothetical protein
MSGLGHERHESNARAKSACGLIAVLQGQGIMDLT